MAAPVLFWCILNHADVTDRWPTEWGLFHQTRWQYLVSHSQTQLTELQTSDLPMCSETCVQLLHLNTVVVCVQ